MGYCSKKKSSEEQIVRSNIESIIMDTINDPDSYEFVNISAIDTIYTKAALYGIHESYKKMLEERKNETKQGYFSMSLEELKKQVKESELDYKSIEDEKQILEFKTVFKYRTNNVYGAKMLYTNEIILNDTLGVSEIKNME